MSLRRLLNLAHRINIGSAPPLSLHPTPLRPFADLGCREFKGAPQSKQSKPGVESNAVKSWTNTTVGSSASSIALLYAAVIWPFPCSNRNEICNCREHFADKYFSFEATTTTDAYRHSDCIFAVYSACSPESSPQFASTYSIRKQNILDL